MLQFCFFNYINIKSWSCDSFIIIRDIIIFVFLGPLAIVSSGFVAAYYWEKQGWPVNKNPVSNIFRILWIFFEPILFAFTGAQVTVC